MYVGDLDSKVTNSMLLQTFKQQFPSVTEAKVICDPVSRISKGYGFIKFSSKEDSERAMSEMQGKMILGRQIKMNYASQRNKNNQEPTNRYGSAQQQPPAPLPTAPASFNSKMMYNPHQMYP